MLSLLKGYTWKVESSWEIFLKRESVVKEEYCLEGEIRSCLGGADSFLQIVNPKGEMKGSAITGPVGKEAAELWPVS